MSHIRTALSLAFVSCVTVTSLAACSVPASDAAVETSSQSLTDCSVDGVWAIKVETPVTWQSSFVVQGGTGTVTNWLKSTRVQNGLTITDASSLCGVVTPDYQSTALFGSEKYGLRFPGSLFEGNKLPTFPLTATLSSNNVGATYTSDPVATVVGATMPSPAADPWPSNGAALTLADSDQDAKPGVTADMSSEPGMVHPPVNALRSARASRVYVAFRQALKSTGTVKSCTRVEGTGTPLVINNKPAIDSHVVGCQREDGTDCSASEFKLLDSSAPVYAPSGDAIVTMVKVTPETTCADIRAMDFAAHQ
jgi:hypothetical protein